MSADAEACGDRLRVLITGNIHGGEVEGKEALQQIMREVVTGLEDEERVEILSGIEAGERVVVQGYETLKDKTPVKVSS